MQTDALSAIAASATTFSSTTGAGGAHGDGVGVDAAVYKGYTQDALNAQYDNKSRVPNWNDRVKEWKRRSDDFLEEIRDGGVSAEGEERGRRRRRRRVEFKPRIRYGDAHEREYVDVFVSAALPSSDDASGSSVTRYDDGGGGGELNPVHVFLHGGYWRSMSNDLFYFVAKPLVKRGVTVVLVEYPLIPIDLPTDDNDKVVIATTMDDLVASCRKAMQWIGDNIERVGSGDPDRITVSGHSAGGHLAAMLLLATTPSPNPSTRIAGVCAISGLYNLRPVQLSNVNDTLRMDDAMMMRNSPVLLEPPSVPATVTQTSPLRKLPLLFLCVGEHESEEYHAQSAELADTWSALVPLPPVFVVEGKNHFDVLDVFVESDDRDNDESGGSNNRGAGVVLRTIIDQIFSDK